MQEKYGVKVSELEAAVSLWEDMLAETKANLGSGEVNRAGEMKYSIKEGPKGKYVEADRQVIYGQDPKSWGEQVEKYIHKKITQGETVEIPTDDGDVLILNEETVGKSSFRNFLRSENRYMNDEEYLTKLNAETHIDELAKISTRGKEKVPDFDGIHGEMAEDGWNYRTAFFKDEDGKYYRLTISTALGREGKLVYNIENIRERSFPTDSGSSDANIGAQGSFANSKKTSDKKTSSTNSIPATPQNVNRKNSLKTEDLLSPEYASQMQNDTSSTASGPPSPRGEGFGIDEYFDDLHSRAEVIDDKRLADAEKIVKNSMNKDKSTLGEKVEKAKSFAMRRMVNSGYALTTF